MSLGIYSLVMSIQKTMRKLALVFVIIAGLLIYVVFWLRPEGYILFMPIVVAVICVLLAIILFGSSFSSDPESEAADNILYVIISAILR